MRSPFRSKLSHLALIVLLPAIAPAQNMPSAGMTSIHGAVHDAITHRPLERVILDIDAQESGNVQQVETDSMGKFSVLGLSAAVYIIRVRYPGYEEASERLDLTVTSSNYLDFQLHPLPAAKTSSIAPEGPRSGLDARLAAVPEKARKEIGAARECLEKGRDPQSCIDHIRKAIKVYPEFPDFYVMLATAYMQAANAAEARSALDHAINLNQKLPEAWFTLGMLQNQQKDYIGAEKSLLEGLKLNWESPQGHYEIARTYWTLGRLQQAEPHALEAVRLQPTLAPIHVLLGNIALRKQDAPGALREFQEYLRLDPNGPMAQGTRAMVKKIQEALNAKQ